MSVFDVINKLQDTVLRKYNVGMESTLGASFGSTYKTGDESIYDVPNVPDDKHYTTHRTFSLPKGSKRGNVLPFGEQEEKKKKPDEEELVDDPNTDVEDPLDVVQNDPDTDESNIDPNAEVEDPTEVSAAEEDPNAAVEEAPPEEAPVEDPNAAVDPNADPNAAAGMDPNAMAGGDPNADPNAAAGMDPNAMGGDPNAMGMGMPGEKSKTELGRIYELKKIYARLTSIESYLSNESEPELLEVRDYVSKTIQMFELIASNYNSYKDKLDDTIILLYKFLNEVYSIVRNFYKKLSEKNNK